MLDKKLCKLDFEINMVLFFDKELYNLIILIDSSIEEKRYNSSIDISFNSNRIFNLI